MLKKKKIRLLPLKRRAWKAFSLYIRKRDKGICFTCGLKKPIEKMMAGHVIPKAQCGIVLMFEELNTYCQCYRCNINLGGYGVMFAHKLGSSVISYLLSLVELKPNWKDKIKAEFYKSVYEKYEKRTTSSCSQEETDKKVLP